VIRRAALLVAVILCASTACASSTTTETNVVTATNVVTVTTTASAPTPSVRHYSRFQMPSKNVGCIYEPSSQVMRCDILSGLVPEPTEPCPVDWTGFVLEETGPAQPSCAGDTVYDAGAPVLDYGERWSRGRLACESLQTGLRCENEDGHGFTLARSSSKAF
jgi:uncharacterized protein DUF6636